MKKLYGIALLGLCGLTACQDKCQETRVFRQQESFQVSLADLRQNGVAMEAPRNLQNPGKIYVKGNYLFINEVKEGIHLIDNSNPSAPKPLAFVRVRGNADMAVKGDYLYADSYTDFLVFDISDPGHIKQVKRIENVFASGMIQGISWYVNTGWNGQSNVTGPTLTDFKTRLVTQVNETDCQRGTPLTGIGWVPGTTTTGQLQNMASGTQSAIVPSGGSGTGGSMARFAIVDNLMYAVTNQKMQVFNVSNPADPQPGRAVSLGWGIETIFPYKDRLYIGTTTGLQILDNSNPENPTPMSTLAHVRACDPVVVHGNHAYVTLHAGASGCGNIQTNQLDLIDVANGYSPKLLKTFPMQSPHGLGIDAPSLFVCEGQYGLKVFDVGAPEKLDKNLRQHYKGMDAYDVIPLNSRLLMLIGKDGFYQYDYSDRDNLKLLSKLPVVRP